MNWVPVGRVVSVHGIRGEVKFYYYNEVKGEFLRYTSLFALKDDRYIELEPLGAVYRKNFYYLSFRGLSSPQEVSFLAGKELFVREGDLPLLEDGEYYEYQLIGLEVVDVHGTMLGKVRSILRSGAHDVLIVAGEKEIMLPMVEGFVVEVDIKGGTIRVDAGGLA